MRIYEHKFLEVFFVMQVLLTGSEGSYDIFKYATTSYFIGYYIYIVHIKAK